MIYAWTKDNFETRIYIVLFFWNMIKLSRDSKQMMDGSLSPKQIIKK